MMSIYYDTSCNLTYVAFIQQSKIYDFMNYLLKNFGRSFIHFFFHSDYKKKKQINVTIQISLDTNLLIIIKDIFKFCYLHTLGDTNYIVIY